MTPQEANKIIAEFMGNKWDRDRVAITEEDGFTHYHTPYSKNLDALVPVWEKLKLGTCGESLIFNKNCMGNWEADFYSGDSESETIQEAACIATAKAIKELK